jgi:hypothetical protein
MKFKITMLVVCFALSVAYAAAQTAPAPDTLKVDYFSGANFVADEAGSADVTVSAPDGTFRIINPGTSGGELCANIYVFDSYQELSECCSCPLSPDSLRTLSVNHDLTYNPLTGVVLNTGAIKVVSTAAKGTWCPYYPSSLAPIAGLRAWMTHIQNAYPYGVTGTYGDWAITETASQDATLSSAEVKRLQAECYAIQLDGSGKGLCTCGYGD